MSDDADAAREYERLRAELAEFVLEILSERIATGKEPELSQALVDAIDRRVDAAVDERLGKLGPADATRPAATRRTTPVRRNAPEPNNRFKLILLAAFGAAALVAIVFVVIRYLPSGPTNTTTRTGTGNETTVIQVDNGQIASPANQTQGNSLVPPLPLPVPQPGPVQPN